MQQETECAFFRDVLHLDARSEVDRIAATLHDQVFKTLRRHGGVVGVSGGVDSAVVLAIAVRALGADRVVALLLPERESSEDSIRLGRLVCKQVGVTPIVEDVTGPLLGYGAYRRRDEVLQAIFPDYDETYQCKITLPPNLLEDGTLNFFRATIVSPEGKEQSRRLRPTQLRAIVAATNFKQRSRAAMLYHHAELRDYVVIGTPQKNEHDLGFFVKHGDGAMDVMPIVHLFKSQVYQLADYLDVPSAVRLSTPTSDTYSAGSSQEEFFFRLPFDTLDPIWYGLEHDVPSARVAEVMGLTVEQVERVYTDIRHKQEATAYLRTQALAVCDECEKSR